MIDSERLGSAYSQLERCNVVVAAALPRFVELTPSELRRFDAILVCCDERTMLTPAHAESVARMSMIKPVLAIVADATAGAGLTAARVGFHGLVARDVAPRALDRAIEAVIQGELAFPRATLSALARGRVLWPLSGPHLGLTMRERQVIDLIALGATDAKIGAALGISRSTAHKHVLSALRRLKVRTRSQLVAAVRESPLHETTGAEATNRAEPAD